MAGKKEVIISYDALPEILMEKRQVAYELRLAEDVFHRNKNSQKLPVIKKEHLFSKDDFAYTRSVTSLLIHSK